MTLIRYLVLVPLLMLVGCSDQDPQLDPPVRLEGGIFGTFYQVTIADSLTHNQAEALEEGFVAELDSVDAAMSIYHEDSELMDLNRTPPGEWMTLSSELFGVLAVSQTVARSSDGAFDVTVGGLVNLWSFGAEERPQSV